VLNWSISRNHKEIWNSTKIRVTVGMYVTQGDSVQRPQISGPRGWPAGLPAFESVWTKTSQTCVYTRRERLWRWRKSVEAELIGGPATWLGWPAASWRVTTLGQVGGALHGCINTPPLPLKVDTHTTFWRFHLQSSLSWCSS
jgi:hypothetical protein